VENLGIASHRVDVSAGVGDAGQLHLKTMIKTTGIRHKHHHPFYRLFLLKLIQSFYFG